MDIINKARKIKLLENLIAHLTNQNGNSETTFFQREENFQAIITLAHCKLKIEEGEEVEDLEVNFNRSIISIWLSRQTLISRVTEGISNPNFTIKEKKALVKHLKFISSQSNTEVYFYYK